MFLHDFLLILCGKRVLNLIYLYLCYLVIQVQQSELMVILRTMGEHPLDELVQGLVALVVAYTNLLDGHFRHLVIFQDGNELIQRGLIGEVLFEVLLYVDTDDGQIALYMSALQVEDIGKGVERYTERILCQGSIQEEVISRDALAAEVTALLTEVMSER